MLHEKNGQPIKGFVCHVDEEKAVQGFQGDQNKIIIRVRKVALLAKWRMS